MNNLYRKSQNFSACLSLDNIVSMIKIKACFFSLKDGSFKTRIYFELLDFLMRKPFSFLSLF